MKAKEIALMANGCKIPVDKLKEMIIDYAKQEVKEKTEELEMRFYIQKLHCKLFHRQKISTWLMSCWYSLKYFIKSIK